MVAWIRPQLALLRIARLVTSEICIIRLDMKCAGGSSSCCTGSIVRCCVQACALSS
jgi:hypothetical protein